LKPSLPPLLPDLLNEREPKKQKKKAEGSLQDKENAVACSGGGLALLGRKARPKEHTNNTSQKASSSFVPMDMVSRKKKRPGILYPKMKFETKQKNAKRQTPFLMKRPQGCFSKQALTEQLENRAELTEPCCIAVGQACCCCDSNRATIIMRCVFDNALIFMSLK